MNWAWKTLGIACTDDSRAIRRAYADRLRALDVDADPEGFAELRRAREAALAWAGQSARRDPEPEIESGGEVLVAENRADLDAAEAGGGIWSEPEPEPEPEPEAEPEPQTEATSSSDALALSREMLDPPHVPGEGEAALTVTPQVPSDDPVTTAGPDVRPATQPAWNAPRPPANPWAAAIEGLGGHGDVTTGMGRSDTDTHFQAILALFFSGEQGELPDLDAAQVEQLRGHVEALLTSPRMEEIDFHADTERWMGEVLARACPESDPVVRRVAEYFGWTTRADEIGLTPAADFVARRVRSLDFLEAVQRPRHPMHRAWRELSRHADETSRRGRVPAKQIAKLLTIVRRDHPALETLFDPYRVSLWEPDGGRPLATDRVSGWWLIVPAFFLLRFCAQMAGDDHRPVPKPPNPIEFKAPDGRTVTLPPIARPLTAATADIDSALEHLYGDAIDLVRLEQANPRLFALMMKAWEDARSRNETTFQLRGALRELMWKSYRAGIKRADYDLVADEIRFTLDRVRALRAKNPQACVDFFNGKDVEEAPAIADRQRALIVRTVLETGAVPDKEREPDTFPVPPGVIDRAAADAGIDRKAFVDAINFEGKATTQCDARITLMETALALPRKQGLKLLRNLS